MLEYTGHPLVDVGAAVIAAFAGKEKPEEVAKEDLKAVAQYIESHYTQSPLRSFLTSVFPNSGYVNPTMKESSRKEFMREYLFGFEQENASINKGVCAYCGRKEYVKVYRQHVPLITGEGLLNFFPNADPGLPVCQLCLLCIQAFPLGTAKCGGRILLVRADDPQLTKDFAAKFLQQNRQYLQLADLSKYPDVKFPKTILVATLTEIEGKRAQYTREAKPCSVAVYHFTNYGTNADITIYHLPFQLVDFIQTALRAKYRRIWDGLVNTAWQKEKGEPVTGQSRNYFYDGLFTLPKEAPRFARTYLLRRAYRAGRDKNDPRVDYSIKRDLDLISWEFTSLFLRKVMNMQKERIIAIKEVADRLSDYVASENDRRFPGFIYGQKLCSSAGNLA